MSAIRLSADRVGNRVINTTKKSDSTPPSIASRDHSDAMVSDAVILFVVSAVQFLTPFMLSAVGVALPAIGLDFSASMEIDFAAADRPDYGLHPPFLGTRHLQIETTL